MDSDKTHVFVSAYLNSGLIYIKCIRRWNATSGSKTNEAFGLLIHGQLEQPVRFLILAPGCSTVQNWPAAWRNYMTFPKTEINDNRWNKLKWDINKQKDTNVYAGQNLVRGWKIWPCFCVQQNCQKIHPVTTGRY